MYLIKNKAIHGTKASDVRGNVKTLIIDKVSYMNEIKRWNM